MSFDHPTDIAKWRRVLQFAKDQGLDTAGIIDTQSIDAEDNRQQLSKLWNSYSALLASVMESDKPLPDGYADSTADLMVMVATDLRLKRGTPPQAPDNTDAAQQYISTVTGQGGEKPYPIHFRYEQALRRLGKIEDDVIAVIRNKTGAAIRTRPDQSLANMVAEAIDHAFKAGRWHEDLVPLTEEPADIDLPAPTEANLETWLMRSFSSLFRMLLALGKTRTMSLADDYKGFIRVTNDPTKSNDGYYFLSTDHGLWKWYPNTEEPGGIYRKMDIETGALVVDPNVITTVEPRR